MASSIQTHTHTHTILNHCSSHIVLYSLIHTVGLRLSHPGLIRDHYCIVLLPHLISNGNEGSRPLQLERNVAGEVMAVVMKEHRYAKSPPQPFNKMAGPQADNKTEGAVVCFRDTGAPAVVRVEDWLARSPRSVWDCGYMRSKSKPWPL